MLVRALTNLPAMITVIIGILVNNAHHNRLRSCFLALEVRFDSLEHKLDGGFTRIEAQLH